MNQHACRGPIPLHLLFFSVVVLISSSAFAQIEYEPGYYVKIGGDTVRTEIKPVVNTGHFVAISVKRRRGDVIVYQPADLISFGLGHNRLFVPILTDSKQPVFAEVLVSARALLLRDDAEFYIRKDSTTELLDGRMIKFYKNGRSYRMRNTSYRSTLTRLLFECDSLMRSIEKANYLSADLEGIIAAFGRCVGSEPRSYDDRPNIGFQYFLGLGQMRSTFSLITTKVRWNAGARQDIGSGQFSSSNTISFGIGVIGYSKNDRGKTGWLAEVAYLDNDFVGVVNTVRAGTNYHYDLNLRARSAKLALGFKMNILGAKNPVYVKGGALLNLPLNPTYRVIQRVTYSTGYVEYNSIGGDEIRKLVLGLFGAVGFEKYVTRSIRIYGELRGEIDNGYVGEGARLLSHGQALAFAAGLKYQIRAQN